VKGSSTFAKPVSIEEQNDLLKIKQQMLLAVRKNEPNSFSKKFIALHGNFCEITF
jgi:hypothetical protein